MRNEFSKFFIRNAVEVAVLVYLLVYFGSDKRISFLSLTPLLFVFLAFLFDFYKLYVFYIKQDIKSLRNFQSKFLFYTFGWYFLPIFSSIYLILKDLNAINGQYLLIVCLISGVLYFYNFKVSRELIAQNDLI